MTKMTKGSAHILPFFLTTFILGAIFFTLGFFPLTSNSAAKSSSDSLPTILDDITLDKSNYQRQISKVVLMIVDAMRYDFVSEMNFTKESIGQQSACLVKLKVEVPTVTMPRIKSITTGSVSNFIDVLVNLGSTELFSDSIIHQIRNRGDKIIFYGDNTWTKLYPRSFHRAQENSDSFFVKDFYEGDQNITKRLRTEFQNSDWQFMILHYLGLDHIGHVEGSTSSKIPDKLHEMDRVTKQIFTALSKDKKISLPNILILTSDHGMRISGGHGGSSPEEIFIPLVVFQKQCSLTKDVQYNQIDITPTLAILLGLPIPASSIGKIISSMLNVLTETDQLYAHHYNTLHLFRKTRHLLLDSYESKMYTKWYDTAEDFHKQFLKSITSEDKGSLFLFESAKGEYERLSERLSNLLISQFTHFDARSILIGLILSAMSTISLILYKYLNIKSFSKGKILKDAIKSIFAGFVLSSLYCLLTNGFIPLFNWFSIGVLSIVIIFTMQQHWRCLKAKREFKNHLQIPSSILCCVVFMVLALSSSSFIEEEHQLWYYIGMSFFIYLAFQESRLSKKPEIQIENDFFDVYCRNDNIPFFKWLKISHFDKVENLFSSTKHWILIGVIHIFIRRLNQTGDKWQHVPDVADWFAMNENHLKLSIMVVIGLVLLVTILKDYTGILTTVLSLTAAILILHYSAVTGGIRFFESHESKSNTTFLIFWLNIIEIIVINYCPAIYRIFFSRQHLLPTVKSLLGVNITIFSLIAMLLHKPHNMILIPCCLITIQVAFGTCDKLYKDHAQLICVKAFLSYWIGSIFYFYQGNSNSLATIDITPGYIGLNTYNPIIAGIFITMNTYSGPFCAALMLLHEIFDESDHSKTKKSLNLIGTFFSLLLTFRLCFYFCIMFTFRYHLFIWTVFSPKYFYELSYFIWFLILFIMNLMYFKIVKII